MLLVLLIGCLHQPVFSNPIEIAAAPVHVDPPADPLACPAAAPYVPDDIAPWTIDGTVQCRGVIVPEVRLTRLLDRSKDADYWSHVYEVSVSHREADRATCEAVGVERDQLRTALAWQKAATIGGVVGALVVGVAVGGVVR